MHVNVGFFVFLAFFTFTKGSWFWESTNQKENNIDDSELLEISSNLMSLGRREDLRILFEEAILAQSCGSGCKLAYGKFLISEGQYYTGLQSCLSAMQAHSNDMDTCMLSPYWLCIGDGYYNLKQNSKAASYYEMIIGSCPSHCDEYLNAKATMIDISFDQGDITKVKSLSRPISLWCSRESNPEIFSDISLRLAMALVLDNNETEAKLVLRDDHMFRISDQKTREVTCNRDRNVKEVIGIENNLVLFHQLLILSKDLTKAAEIAKEVIDIIPVNATGHLLLSQTLLMSNQTNEAKNELHSAMITLHMSNYDDQLFVNYIAMFIMNSLNMIEEYVELGLRFLRAVSPKTAEIVRIRLRRHVPDFSSKESMLIEELNEINALSFTYDPKLSLLLLVDDWRHAHSMNVHIDRSSIRTMALFVIGKALLKGNHFDEAKLVLLEITGRRVQLSDTRAKDMVVQVEAVISLIDRYHSSNVNANHPSKSSHIHKISIKVKEEIHSDSEILPKIENTAVISATPRSFEDDSLNRMDDDFDKTSGKAVNDTERYSNTSIEVSTVVVKESIEENNAESISINVEAVIKEFSDRLSCIQEEEVNINTAKNEEIEKISGEDSSSQTTDAIDIPQSSSKLIDPQTTDGSEDLQSRNLSSFTTLELSTSAIVGTKDSMLNGMDNSRNLTLMTELMKLVVSLKSNDSSAVPLTTDSMLNVTDDSTDSRNMTLIADSVKLVTVLQSDESTAVSATLQSSVNVTDFTGTLRFSVTTNKSDSLSVGTEDIESYDCNSSLSNITADYLSNSSNLTQVGDDLIVNVNHSADYETMTTNEAIACDGSNQEIDVTSALSVFTSVDDAALDSELGLELISESGHEPSVVTVDHQSKDPLQIPDIVQSNNYSTVASNADSLVTVNSSDAAVPENRSVDSLTTSNSFQPNEPTVATSSEIITNVTDTSKSLAPSLSPQRRVAEQYLKLASAYCSVGDYDRCIKELAKVLKKDSSYTDAYYLRGLTYLESASSQSSMEGLVFALTNAAKDFRLIFSQLDIGNKTAIEKSIDCAKILIQIGKPVNAIDLLIDARIFMNCSNPNGFFDLNDRAVNVTEFKTIDCCDHIATDLLVKALLMNHSYHQAIPLLQICSQTDQTNVTISDKSQLQRQQWLADAYERVDMFDEAMKIMLSLFDRGHVTATSLAQAYVRNERHVEAIRVYEGVIARIANESFAELDSNDTMTRKTRNLPAGLRRQIAETHKLIGMIYSEQLNDTSSATRHFDEAMEHGLYDKDMRRYYARVSVDRHLDLVKTPSRNITDAAQDRANESQQLIDTDILDTGLSHFSRPNRWVVRPIPTPLTYDDLNMNDIFAEQGFDGLNQSFDQSESSADVKSSVSDKEGATQLNLDAMLSSSQSGNAFDDLYNQRLKQQEEDDQLFGAD